MFPELSTLKEISLSLVSPEFGSTISKIMLSVLFIVIGKLEVLKVLQEIHRTNNSKDHKSNVFDKIGYLSNFDISKYIAVDVSYAYPLSTNFSTYSSISFI